jgi:hypothetical protein
MRARRDVTLSVLCLILAACGAAAAGPETSLDPTVGGVGVLPVSNPQSQVIATDPSTTVAATELPTTTLAPLPAIGTLVAGNKLLMIGDSITASAAKRYGGEFCDALVPLGWQVEVDAEPSRFVDFGNDVLDKRLSAKWDAAYVFLGTNYLGDQEAYRKQLEKIVERLSPMPVVLLTVTMFEDTRQEVNDAITLVGAEFPNVRVVDWSSIAAADAAKILRGDGHHLTNDGRLVLASTVAGVMGKAPQDPGKCLDTSFHNDSGASVNGTDDPPQRPVGNTTTTVKPTTQTTKPPATQPTSPNPTAPPGIPPATTTPPTSPPTTKPPAVTSPTTTPPPAGGTSPGIGG